MRRLTVLCAIGFLLAAASGAHAALWEIMDLGLQDTTNFVREAGGALNSRTDLASDPGTRFNITLTGSGWTDIQIGDGFDLPYDNAGLVAATGNSGNLSGYSGFTMAIHNPGDDGFLAALFMNTGWTDPPWNQTDRYYQNGDGSVTWIGPGQTVRLTLDFSNAALWNGSGYTTGSAVQNLAYVSNIGFKIGANLGNDGEVASGVAFDVDVVPLPGAVLLGMLGMGAAGMKLRKYV